MKKVLFNASVNIVGGGLKNSFSFIDLILSSNSTLESKHLISWHFAVNPTLYKLIALYVNDNTLKEAIIVVNSPARSYASRKILYKYCLDNNIDLVYTMGGPAYVNFPCFHVMGLSEPFLLSSSPQHFFRNRSKISALYLLFTTLYKRLYCTKADLFIFQTILSSNQFHHHFPCIPFSKHRIVSNCPAVIPSAAKLSNLSSLTISNRPSIANQKFNVLIPSAYYPHKNLEFIIELVASFNLPEFEFFFCISSDHFNRLVKKYPLLSVQSQQLKNLGQYSPRDAERIYSRADIVLLPSFLEVFSATYIEAMLFGKPLVVPRLDFVTMLCGQYPYYFEDNNLSSLKDALLNSIKGASKSLIPDPPSYLTPRERTSMIINTINDCLR
jgi:glycosyltransferase involved in cell wall biosynthesis